VELLVAVGLTAILMWGLLQLYTSAVRFSTAMFAEAELCAGGRAALDRLSHELTSAATLDVGYMTMTNNTGEPSRMLIDEIRFVAPVGVDNQLAHVRYYVDDKGELRRAVLEPSDGAPLSDKDATASLNGDTLGINVRRFNISYVESSGVIKGDDDPFENLERPHDTNPSDGVEPLPRAVLIEIQLVDPKEQASITLSSGAFLGGSGL